MAEQLIKNFASFIGLSSDTKTTSGILAGSTWRERDTGNFYVFDGTDWGLVAPDYIIGEILAGNAFTTSHEFTGILTGADTDILIQVGTKDVLINVGVSGTAAVEFQLFETPTFSAAGSALTGVNKDRRSSNTSLAVYTHTPTVSVAGTALFPPILAGSLGDKKATLSGSGVSTEFILAPSTDYLIRSTNLDAGTQDMTVITNCIERVF